MKKVLSVLSLVAVLSITAPVFAAPDGHRGPARHGEHHIRAGHHHRHHSHHHVRPYRHGGVSIYAGSPRHSYWNAYRRGAWRRYGCDYRLGYCDFLPPFYYPASGIGLNIHF